MLRSSQAAGRDYVLLATDEGAPSYFNFNSSPVHLAGVPTRGLKFGLYANWQGATDQIADDGTLETELYDYSTAEGQAELDNLKHDPRIPALKQTLLGNLIPNVLRAPLPGLLGAAQTASRDAYLAYDALLRKFPAPSCNSSGSTRISRRCCPSARTSERHRNGPVHRLRPGALDAYHLLGLQGVSTLPLEAAIDNLRRAVHLENEIMRLLQTAGLAQAMQPLVYVSPGMKFVDDGRRAASRLVSPDGARAAAEARELPLPISRIGARLRHGCTAFRQSRYASGPKSWPWTGTVWSFGAAVTGCQS